MSVLMWFRSDLRVSDNRALAAAVREGESVVALFLCTPEQWREHSWSPTKVDFLLRNLEALSDRLARVGIPLLVREVPDFDASVLEVRRVAENRGCGRVVCNREYELNEQRRDRSVAVELERRDIRFDGFDDQTVVRPGELLTGEGRPYSVFTPFKKRWMRYLAQEGLPDVGGSPSAVGESCAAGSVPTSVGGFDPNPEIGALWPAGEAEAEGRLRRFLSDSVEGYSVDRDFPSLDSTSRLSPYLSLGVISVRACLAAAVAANRGELEGGREGVSTWISELVWRDFYRHVVVGFPRVSMGRAFRRETEAVEWCDPESGLEAWCRGRTGVPFVDAGMRQLVETGWMHNRMRMVTAMYLSKDLLIDWRLGEDFFMRHLVDGDLASNNGGWQWAASTGTDAAPYFRMFNPWTQGRRFDPEAAFIKDYVPELRDQPAKSIHSPDAMEQARRKGLDYPAPIVEPSMARARVMERFQAAKDRVRSPHS